MMTDDRDPIPDPMLQALFAEARQELDGEAFTALVMVQTRNLSYRMLAGLLCFVLMLAAGAWFLAIPPEFAQLIAQLLAKPLIELGDSWIAWLILPVNNIGSLLILGVKGLRMLRKKFVGASYAY